MLKRARAVLAAGVVGAVIAIPTQGAWANNAAGEGAGAGAQAIGNPIDWFPNYGSAQDVQACFAVGYGGTLSVQQTDACVAGDIWYGLGAGFPGGTFGFGVTDGTAEGCACTHSGGYDGGAGFSVGGDFAIVIQGAISVPGGFPASNELRMSGAGGDFLAFQTQVGDACGVM